MSKNRVVIASHLIIIGSLVLLSGCQTVPYQGQARETKKKPQEGGVISLKENFRDEDRQKADEKMTKNCYPKSVKIVEEGKVVVGQKVDTGSTDTRRDDSRKTVGSLFGMPLVSGEAAGTNTQSSSTTTALKEWQIAYACDQTKVRK